MRCEKIQDTIQDSLCCSAESLSDKIWVKARIVVIAEEQSVFPYPIIRALWMSLWREVGGFGSGDGVKECAFLSPAGGSGAAAVRLCICVCEGEAYSLW